MDFDVTIIGASSAGLFAAKRLARAGSRVAVFERQADLNPARRTLIITPQINRLLGNLPPEIVLHHVSKLQVSTPGASARVVLMEPDLVVERRHLAHHLLAQAQDAGALVHFGHRFMALTPQAAGVRVHFQTPQGERTCLTRAVIGADGLTSDVARAAGIQPPPRVPILQAETHLPAGWDPTVTQVWFNMHATRYFYWLIPESTARGVVGLVGDGREKIHTLLDRFLGRMGLQSLAHQGAQVAMHHPRLHPWGRVGNAPVLLVGDAAGQVKVTTVGGTVSGLWGAAAAARSILKGIPYAHTLRPLKRELDLHWYIRLLLERMGNSEFDTLVQSLSPAVLDFLGRHNRDAMITVFWKLPLLQPRLAILGLRLLLSLMPPRSTRKTSPLKELE